MADREPLEVVFDLVRTTYLGISYPPEMSKAVLELERRKEVEDRRDEWLKNPAHKIELHTINSRGEHLIALNVAFPAGGSWTGGGHGPDYWTAMSKALDAAGAPKRLRHMDGCCE
jgi:hypothetical protein